MIKARPSTSPARGRRYDAGDGVDENPAISERRMVIITRGAAQAGHVAGDLLDINLKIIKTSRELKSTPHAFVINVANPSTRWVRAAQDHRFKSRCCGHGRSARLVAVQVLVAEALTARFATSTRWCSAAR